MRQSKFISARVAPNCYKTVAVDKGIIQYYSVCVGNTIDFKKVREGYDMEETGYMGVSWMQIYRLVDITRTFNKTPYKQCYPKVYTQAFKFVIFKVFTPWKEICFRGGLEATFKHNSMWVRESILELKKYCK
jgi:hypothetical protein